jgi:hypothetical protein
MMMMPASVDTESVNSQVLRGHALTLDTKRGDFYFEYVVKEEDLNNSTHNVVKFSKSANGTYVGKLLDSNPRLAQREPHGIKYELDATDGKEYLYHTNNGWNDSYKPNGWNDPNPKTFVAKTDLSGVTIIWQTFLDADWAKAFPKYSRTRLTDVIPLPVSAVYQQCVYCVLCSA